MGFKDIEKFNDSLLAKQVWRMINNPDSLCHRMFKARFFLNCSILEAKDPTLGSYAWKSIIGARGVIREGMVWRIGNGQSVRIREDKWLPVQSNRSVISSLPSVVPETKVSSLINPELRGWNSTLMNQLFLPHETTIICSMPLSIRLPLTKLYGASLLRVCSQQRVPTSFLFLVILLTMQVYHHLRIRGCSGEVCGSLECQTSSSTFPGVRAMMPCPQ